jgi:hypothetical protein
MTYLYLLGKGKVKLKKNVQNEYQKWLEIYGEKVSNWVVRASVVMTILYLIQMFS